MLRLVVCHILRGLTGAVSHDACLLPTSQAAVLGFVGSPWTLATYLIEGGSTPLYKRIKAMTAAAPDVLSALLQHLAVQIAEYMCFQARQHLGPVWNQHPSMAAAVVLGMTPTCQHQRPMGDVAPLTCCR